MSSLFLVFEYVSFIDPYLYSDNSVNSICSLSCVIDISSDCLSWDVSLLVSLDSCDFNTIKTSWTDYLYTKSTFLYSLWDCILDNSSIWKFLFYLASDHISYDCCVKFWLLYLFHVDCKFDSEFLH
ncbi:MAG: hypothetical protein ACD_2C00046G0001 [uncultured bacterium (gcode 4)]|uniref:Uncharacterized protein n=1 Tax=uncultured bacterium (gcode 4) TaxID=1234023 RepID=K2GI11_9BACT|nr:MAG: hypothetical protein ACD_2C00046G0001 [uncultured bacterium (gcode 4)]